MKTKLLFLVLILVISVLCSCDAFHKHDFSGSYSYDETHHWRECECGEKDAYDEHSWNKGIVTLKPTVDSEGERTLTCSVCRVQKTETIEKLTPDHVHSFDKLNNNESAHWYECECGEKNENAAHSWNNGVITTPPTGSSEGIRTFTCTVCRFEKTETIPARDGNGLSFLQSTHYRIPEKLAKTPLTLEAEIYVDPSITGRAGVVFGNYYGIRQDWLFEIYEKGVPRFYYTDTTGSVKDIRFSNVDVRTGDFVHIALTFDFENRAISVYLNGEIAQTIACETDLASDITRYQFVLGGDNRSNNGMYFKGQIKSIAAYSDVRTAQEIADSAKNGTNNYAEDLLLSYLLNENSAGKEIEDLSGNGYNIPVEWLDSNELSVDYAYSFAVVGDTQWLCKYEPGKMEAIYDWIIANKESKNILHVFGLGDITEEWNNDKSEAEWILAQKYISKLNGVVPYSLIRGNHDESTYFLKYFANETYMSQFDGFMEEGDIRNSYMKFTVGSTDYLFITLDYGASDEMLEWANEIVLAHPDHRVIVTTHGYQGFDGNHLTSQNTPSSGDITAGSDVDDYPRGYNNGQQIWEKFVSLHPNIFLVMSGHTPMEDVFLLQSEGVHGNIVNQMLIDPQWMDPQKGGVGMVCMLYFSEDGSQMEVEWISTDTGKYYKEQNQYVVDLNNSINAPAHSFYASYNETHHYMICDCGYTFNKEAHSFDGGVINSDGFIEYSCECGYKRVTSATDDPIAKALQALLEKYYNNGVYYKDSCFYNGDKFWTTDYTDYETTDGMLTLYDFLMGRYGDIKLDLGWNYYDGVYSSVNSDALQGAALLVTGTEGNYTKVTVEEKSYHLIIKLWTDDKAVHEAEIGYYATAYLNNLDGETIGMHYTKVGENGLAEMILPTIGDCVPEYDRFIININYDSLVNTINYSSVSVWDGTSVSTGLSGSGTEADPYLIQSAADFAYLRTSGFGGCYFKLVTSIDFNNIAFTIDSFNGVLDGNHCSIRGINLTNTADNTGLFKTLGIDSYVYDLSLYGTVSGAKYTGALAGSLSGKINNVVNYATVSGAGNLGGVVGNSKSTSLVENCKNYGNVNGTSWNNGGVVGFAQNKVLNCVNYGNVTTSGDCAGGVVGTAHSLVSGCINYGTVTGKGRCGGVVYNSTNTVEKCINYGTVCGINPDNAWDLGGILSYVGEDKSASIINCVNYGTVKGTTGIGGIFALSHDNAGTVTITGCINYGEVITSWGGGGIAGTTKAEITDCENYGTVSGKGQIGSIVGKCYGKVTGCTNYGVVSGTDSIIGGIVGHLYATNYYSVITKTNEQCGTVLGPNNEQLIGKVEGVVEELITLNKDAIGINHRGWYEAPENTLSAYRESYNHGFKYVECDVQFTKDGIPVLLHDDTIDRTSNGSGTLSQMTYEELLQYDFSYDDNDSSVDFSAYRGEKIPTFVEFIALCKELGLHPYIEIKGSITEAEAQMLVKIVSDAGMLDNVSWLSFSGDALKKIVDCDKTARVLFVITNTDATKLAANQVPFAKENLMTGENEVVFDLWHSLAKQDVVDLLSANGILLEVWTVNDPDIMLKLHPYVTGVTSDKYDASQLAKSAE